MSIPVMVELNAAAGGLFSVLGAASSSLLALGRSGEASSAGLAKVGTVAAVGVAAAAGVIVAKSVEAASTFQSEMQHLVTSADLPQSSMKALGDSILSMAGHVGTGADDLAKASYFILSQMKTNAADTATVLNASAELAKVDGSDTVTAVKAMSTAMHDYNIPVSQSVATANQFRAAVAESNTTIGDFSSNLGRVFQASEAAHIGLSDVLGAVATLTSEGMPASQASTLLASTIDHLSAVTPAGAAALKGMGISVTDFEQTIDSPHGLVQGLTMLQDGLKRVIGPDGLEHLATAAKDTAKTGVDTLTAAIQGLPDKAQTSIATIAQVAGGVRGLGVVLGLTGDNLDAFTKNVQGVADGAAHAGKDVDGFGQIQQTVAQQVDELKAAAHSLAIELGSLLLPAVKMVVTGLADFAKFLVDHKAAAVALAAVIGGVLVAAIVTVTAAFWAWAAAVWANPLTWIVAAVILAVAAFVALGVVIYKNRAIFVQWAKDVWQAVMGVVHSLEHAWDNVTHAWDNFYHALQNIWHAIMNVVHAFENVTHIGTSVVGVFRIVEQAIANVIHAFENVGHAIMNVVHWFVAAGSAIIAADAAIWGAVVSAWNAIRSTIVSVAQSIWSAVVSAWNAITSAVSSACATVASVVSSAWNTVVSVTQSVWNTIVSVISGIWSRIVSTVQSAASSVVSAISSGFSRALSAILGFVGSFASAGYNLMMGLVHGITSAVGAVVSAVTGAVSSAYHAVLGAFGIHSPSTVFRDEIGKQLMAGMAIGITENAHLPQNALLNASGNINASIPGFGSFRGGFTANAVASQGNTNITIRVEGPVIGQGMERAAADIWQELLKAKNRGVRLGLA